MEYAIDQKDIDEIDRILTQDILPLGVQCVCLIDLAGNIITSQDNGKSRIDVYSMAALAAANFGAVSAMASLVGEDGFSLLFHKGKETNIFFGRVGSEFLLVVIFGKETSLGFLRLKADQAAEKLHGIFRVKG